MLREEEKGDEFRDLKNEAGAQRAELGDEDVEAFEDLVGQKEGKTAMR